MRKPDVPPQLEGPFFPDTRVAWRRVVLTLAGCAGVSSIVIGALRLAGVL